MVAGTVWAGRAAPPARAETPSILVVGDSLAVGMQPFLDGMLRARDVRWDTRSGRTTPEGLRVLRNQVRAVRPAVVIVSLGTNDGSDPGRFSYRLRRALGLIPPSACVVWANLFRPPRKGAYHALNRVLRRTARDDRRLVLVDWERAVLSQTVVLPDGLHPDADGYRHRSRMIADAVRTRCTA